MIKLQHIDQGKSFDFGKMSEDYAKYRDVYPSEFYEKIHELGLCCKGKKVLDLGTGTGVLPRNLYSYGASFVGTDINENQIKHARRLSEGLNIEYIVTPAEEVEFPENSIDSVMACMCFTYFDKNILLPKLYKMLKDDGRLAIMSLIWLPEESEIAKGSEEIALNYNASWNGVSFKRPVFNEQGIPETYKINESSGFVVDKSFAFDVAIPFTREKWNGRMKATRGIGASLTDEGVKAFEEEHWNYMLKQPEKFDILHSAIFCVLKKTRQNTNEK